MKVEIDVDYNEVKIVAKQTTVDIDVVDFVDYMLEEYTIEDILEEDESGIMTFLGTYLEFDLMNSDPNSFEYVYSQLKILFDEIDSELVSRSEEDENS